MIAKSLDPTSEWHSLNNQRRLESVLCLEMPNKTQTGRMSKARTVVLAIGLFMTVTKARTVVLNSRLCPIVTKAVHRVNIQFGGIV
jgi:hypothetical protein